MNRETDGSLWGISPACRGVSIRPQVAEHDLCCGQFPPGDSVLTPGRRRYSGDAIELIDLPDEVSADQQHQSMVPMELPEAGFDLDETLDSIEAKMIRQALARTNQVRSAAAALLGISMRSLRYRLRKLGIHTSDPPDGSNSSEPPAS